MTALHRGEIVYRVGRTSALRAIYIKPLSGGMVELKTSIFTAKVLRIPATDVFADRDACRAEIERRKQGDAGHELPLVTGLSTPA